MSATDASASEAAHFLPLSTLLAEYDGSLEGYMRASGSRDVVITMPVTMDVAGRKNQKFFVAVGVTWHFESAEPLADAVAAECPAGHRHVFAWVPAHRFGRDDFGIYFDDIGIGDILQNGMIAEIIEQAQVESAVTALS